MEKKIFWQNILFSLFPINNNIIRDNGLQQRVHIIQENFDLATAKMLNKHNDKKISLGNV